MDERAFLLGLESAVEKNGDSMMSYLNFTMDEYYGC